MAPPYVVGVDGGTESLRAGVFDVQGTLVASASSAYDTQFPHPGWAEQRPEDWWQALGDAVSQAIKAAGIEPAQVAAVCLDTTCCTVVVLDEGGAALRPALLWMDMRSAAQAAQVAGCGDAALKVNAAGAGPVSAEWMVPKSLWIKQNEPELWACATTICEFQDFLNFHLTGRMCASVNCASVRWHYSSETGWPLSMLEKLGIPELASKWPKELLPLGAPVGHLTAAAARHLGLLPGTLVAQGGADAFIGILGLGVVQPGQMALLTGSSHLQLGLVDKEIHGPGIFGTYRDAVLPGLHVIEGGQTSTGSIVNWFKKNLVAPGVGYDELNAEAEAVPPGCEGLACLDHFQGNRTPHTDPLSRGALVGLTLKHGRGHVFRALMESVAFGTRLILDTMGMRGYRPESIVIAGGAIRSPLWLQIHADVCNVPFVLTRCCEAPMLGCAVLAAAAAGLYPDITSAAAGMVQVDRVIQPNPEVQERYEQHYRRYIELYPALKGTFHALAAPAAAKPGPGTSDVAAGEDRSGSWVSPAAAGALGAQGRSTGTSPLRGIVSASILAADFSCLGAEVRAAVRAGSQWVHVDMFDGSYVDNFTLGPPVLASLKALCPDAYFDCHLAVKAGSCAVRRWCGSGRRLPDDLPCRGARWQRGEDAGGGGCHPSRRDEGRRCPCPRNALRCGQAARGDGRCRPGPVHDGDTGVWWAEADSRCAGEGPAAAEQLPRFGHPGGWGRHCGDRSGRSRGGCKYPGGWVGAVFKNAARGAAGRAAAEGGCQLVAARIGPGRLHVSRGYFCTQTGG